MTGVRNIHWVFAIHPIYFAQDAGDKGAASVEDTARPRLIANSPSE